MQLLSDRVPRRPQQNRLCFRRLLAARQDPNRFAENFQVRMITAASSVASIIHLSRLRQLLSRYRS